MKYGTLNNGQLVTAPNPLVVGRDRVYNPKDESYIAAGYLPIVETPMPDPTTHSAVYQESWVEENGQIVLVWVEVEPPAEPDIGEEPASESDYIAALERFGAQ